MIICICPNACPREKQRDKQTETEKGKENERDTDREREDRVTERKKGRERVRERKKERINKQNFEYLNACFLCSWRGTTYKSFKFICPSIYLHTHIYLAIFMTVPACP